VFKFFGKRNTAALAALVVAGVAGVGAYAFTATNSVPTQAAGAGVAQVSHFTVSKVSYTFSADTTQVTDISFDLTATLKPSDVAVDLEAHSAVPDKANYVHCNNAATVADGAGKWLVDCPGLTFDNTGDVNGDNDLYVAAVTDGTVNLS
jgi:hypothetical protein